MRVDKAGCKLQGWVRCGHRSRWVTRDITTWQHANSMLPFTLASEKEKKNAFHFPDQSFNLENLSPIAQAPTSDAHLKRT